MGNVKTNHNPRRGEGPCQECERMANLKAKKKSHQEGVQKASGRVCGGRFHGAERIMEHRQKETVGG